MPVRMRTRVPHSTDKALLKNISVCGYVDLYWLSGHFREKVLVLQTHIFLMMAYYDSKEDHRSGTTGP